MTKTEQAAKALAGVDILTLTDGQIMAAANAAGIPMPGRWHLTRIRNARTMIEADRLLAEFRA